MKILAIGDIVGSFGLNKLKELLPKIIEEEKIDFVVVNAENTSGGMGLTVKDFNTLKSLNINAITMGNHTWGKRDIFTFINDPILLRPANYSKGLPGKGYGVFECNNKKILVMNLIGRTDMNVLSENPFTVAESLVNKMTGKVDIMILDFHAEATAEKIAMKYYLDGKVNIIFGTHTHVQTADEEVTEKGTGYITDLGMTGPKESVIGMDIKASTKRFITSLPERYQLAQSEAVLNGCVFELNDETNKVEKAYRISY
jgi:metallophosphoesterase (TIGR00282 family)